MGQSVVSNRKTRKIQFETDLLQISIFPTACGWMALLGRERTVHQLKLGYPDEATLLSQLQNPVAEDRTDWFPELRDLLQAYASGQPVSFAKVRCAQSTQTDFQAKVVDFVKRIPYGQVLSYGDVAAAVGYPGAARAVGTVMSSNRIPIIIPCHRVVAAGGKLGGYSAPRGVELKHWLLELEGKQVAECEGVKM